MSDADALQAIAKIREIEDVIGELKGVRGSVEGFDIGRYEDAAGAQWAGQKRNTFTAQFDAARSSYGRISEQIGQAIEDCKSKQRSLAGSINAVEHPIIAAEAWATAM